MNVARVQLFAGSGLPEQEDRRVGRGYLVDLFEHASGRVAAADDIGLANPRCRRLRPLPAG
jgi:hypothetical protein